MKKCKSCGRVVGKDVEYCDYCGADVLPEKKFLESEQHEPVIESEKVCPHCGNETLEGGVCDICNYGTTYCPKCECFYPECDEFCPDCGTLTIQGEEHLDPGTCIYCGKEYRAPCGCACESCQKQIEKAGSEHLCSNCIKGLDRRRVKGPLLYRLFVGKTFIRGTIVSVIASIFVTVLSCVFLPGYWALIPILPVMLFANIRDARGVSFSDKCFRCGKKEISMSKVIVNIIAFIIRIGIPIMVFRAMV